MHGDVWVYGVYVLGVHEVCMRCVCVGVYA